MFWLNLIFLLVGGFGVWIGAEKMVQKAAKLANYLGVPSLIIGLTIVAFGTSAPELVVSVIASLTGHNQIALGNVIGSNIINISLVLGISAVINPITVSAGLIKRDLVFLTLVTGMVVVMAWTSNQISRIEGIILLSWLVIHTIYSFLSAKRDIARTTTQPGWKQPEFSKKDAFYLVAGTIILSVGAEGMVHGAVGIAEFLQIDKRIIGMTIVAFGTSVPELAASVVAAKEGESDLAVGNILGSNLYNILLILGTAVTIAPIETSVSLVSPDFLFFAITTLILFPLMRTRWRLGKTDGIILLVIFAIFASTIFFS